MAALVQIDEMNGPPPGIITPNISNSNMGAMDAPNLDPVANALDAGDNTFEKWQLFHLVNLAGSSSIGNLQVWLTGAMGGSALCLTNAITSGYSAATYAQPTDDLSSVAVNTMPSGAPGTANLGIFGSLTGTLTSPGYSDFLVIQIQTNIADTAGSTTLLNYQYDETV